MTKLTTEELNEMKLTTIKRDGEKDLRFTGKVIASASGRWSNGREQNRFDEITVYRTSGGNYVLHQEYITFWQGESCTSEAAIYKTPAELNHALGAPTNELIKEILADLGPCFEEFLIEDIA